MKRQSIIAAMIILAVVAVAYAAPQGATIVTGPAQTRTNATAQSYAAQGGNITEINITGETQTSVWQGFWGNTTGNITLEDTSGDQLYTWNLTTLAGEVYASRNSTIDFTSVSTTVLVNNSDCTVDETLTGTGVDRINKTFTNSSVFFPIGTVNITRACRTFTYINSAPQAGVSGFFEEIIVNATGVPSIYVTKINSTAGFDGAVHNFQMIVPENSTTALTTYFFFVEFD